MNDATWIADLAAHGLIKASFVPDEELHELRTLMRTRKQLTREQTRHVQRIQKTLTEANIRLDSVISDIMGASGRRMIEAMIEGERDPRKLAALADRGVKATPKQLYDALHGRLTDHHRFLLKLHLRAMGRARRVDPDIDREVDARVARLDAEGPADKARFSEPDRTRQPIPGVKKLSAVSMLSEIGIDMTRFTDGHLIAWAGMCARSERERRQAQAHATAQGRAMAQDHARPVRVGGQERQKQLLPGAVLAPQSPARTAKGDLRRGGLDPPGHLSHAHERNRPPGPRRRLFRSPLP